MPSGWRVAHANEALVITGGRVGDVLVAKKQWVWPIFEKCRVISLKPFDLEIEI